MIEKDSVITVDSGIKTLASIASENIEFNDEIFQYLIEHLKTCRPKEVAMHSEFIFQAVNYKNKTELIKVLNERKEYLKPNQVERVDKLLKKL